MHNNVVVSICCITYNHKSYVRYCLDGFLMQKTDFDVEVLIHDDYSTDGTEEIIREYQEKYPDIIKPIYQTENQYSNGIRGMNVKYNFPRAKGKYIALCEGDDYWTDPLKLQKQVDFLEKNDEYGLVHTNYNEYYERTEKIVKHRPTHFSRSDEVEYYIKSGDLRTCTVLFRSKFICKMAELFSQDFMKNSVIGDRPLFLLIAANSKIHFIDEVTSVYHITARNSASHFVDIYKYYDYLIKVTILNENLYDYFNITVDRTELVENEKFYQIVLKSKSSLISSIVLMLKSGLNFKYYKEFKSVLLYKIRNALK